MRKPAMRTFQRCWGVRKACGELLAVSRDTLAHQACITWNSRSLRRCRLQCMTCCVKYGNIERALYHEIFCLSRSIHAIRWNQSTLAQGDGEDPSTKIKQLRKCQTGITVSFNFCASETIAGPAWSLSFNALRTHGVANARMLVQLFWLLKKCGYTGISWQCAYATRLAMQL